MNHEHVLLQFKSLNHNFKITALQTTIQRHVTPGPKSILFHQGSYVLEYQRSKSIVIQNLINKKKVQDIAYGNLLFLYKKKHMEILHKMKG